MQFFKRFCPFKPSTPHRPKMHIPITSKHHIVIHNTLAKNSINTTHSRISQFIFNRIRFRRINRNVIILLYKSELLFKHFFPSSHHILLIRVILKTLEHFYFLYSFDWHIQFLKIKYNTFQVGDKEYLVRGRLYKLVIF